jgi:hypothetical protein
MTATNDTATETRVVRQGPTTDERLDELLDTVERLTDIVLELKTQSVGIGGSAGIPDLRQLRVESDRAHAELKLKRARDRANRMETRDIHRSDDKWIDPLAS